MNKNIFPKQEHLNYPKYKEESKNNPQQQNYITKSNEEKTNQTENYTTERCIDWIDKKTG